MTLFKEMFLCSVISKTDAIEILGSMMGGYNVPPLVEALK